MRLLIGLAALVVLFVAACDVEFTSNLTTVGLAAASPPGIPAGPVVVGDFVELPGAPEGRDVARVAEAAAVARVARVVVRTATGRDCRQSVIAMIDRQRRLFTTLSSDVRSGRSMTKAVDRFSSGQSELSRWYTSEINRCTRRATPVEKAAIAQAMRSF